jgi:IS5 family transposase
MRSQPGFFDVDDRLKRLSDLGDQLEAFRAAVDFEIFRADLVSALAYSDGAHGGRPPLDAVMMFKILVIQAANNLSDERTEFLINDRLSFMRFLGLGLSDRVPDARTIWLFRERLTKAGAIKALFDRFDAALRASGYIAMSGQIVDASLISAPKQRNTEDEKRAIKEGRIPDEWKDKPAKLRQKDRDARWTVKFSKAKERADGTKPPVDIAIPTFGYQNHISIDSGFGFIRKWAATDAAAYEGARLREDLLDKTNTSRQVWADTAYRSKANEAFMEKNGFVSRIQLPPDMVEAQALGISFFAGEAEDQRIDEVLRDAYSGKLKPLYNHLASTPNLAGAPIPMLPEMEICKTSTNSHQLRPRPRLSVRMLVLHHHQCAGAQEPLPHPGRSGKIVRENAAIGIDRFFITDDNFARNKVGGRAFLDRLDRTCAKKNLKVRLAIQVDTLAHKSPASSRNACRRAPTRSSSAWRTSTPTASKR